MKRIWLSIALAAVIYGCTGEFAEEQEEQSSLVAVADESSVFVPGEIIVQLSEEMTSQVESGSIVGAKTKSETLNSAFSALGVTSFERLYPDAGEWEPRHRAAGLHRWYKIKYDTSHAAATKASFEISTIEGVEYSEPVRRIRPTAVFDDPYLNKQWGYYNGTDSGNSIAGMDINVLPVWQNYTGGTPNVIVAVIDTGVDLEHPDLAPICIPPGPNGSRCFLDQYNGYYILPDDHGTHVAGTVAAINNNGIGVSGVAGGLDGNGGVRIMSCQMMHIDPSDPDVTMQGNEHEAIVWAADHGAVIAQNSWSTVFETEEDAKHGSVGTCGAAIDYFVKYAGCDAEGNQRTDSPMKGGVVFFSAGNDAWRYAWPAMYENCIAVGAMNSLGKISYYSNYGDWVDICAPGGDYKVGPMIYSTIPGGEYGNMQGTSMACPHVSGVAALLVSYFGGPGFTNEMLLERLLKGANTTKVMSSYKIGPLVDAYGAFTYGGSIPPAPVGEVNMSVKANSITASWKVTSDEDDGKSYAYQVIVSDDKSAVESYQPGTKAPSGVKTVTVKVDSLNVGDEITCTIDKLKFETGYFISIAGYDYCGNYSDKSPVIPVSTLKNNPPVISTEYDGEYMVKTFETLKVDFRIDEPDGHNFSVTGTMGSDAATLVSRDKNQYQFTIVGNAAPEGSYTAEIVATDEYGAVEKSVINYVIFANHPPVIVKDIQNIQFNMIGQNLELNLNDYFYDEDEEPLTYTTSTSASNVAHPYVEGSRLIISSLGYGMVEMSVTGTDAAGKSCSTAFKVLVRDSSRPVDIYPNPVIDNLYVRPGSDLSADIDIVNKAGATVYSGSVTATPFEPCCIDLSGLAGGSYYVHITAAGIDAEYSIVKL